jgi:hypothetical protein
MGSFNLHKQTNKHEGILLEILDEFEFAINSKAVLPVTDTTARQSP